MVKVGQIKFRKFELLFLIIINTKQSISSLLQECFCVTTTTSNYLKVVETKAREESESFFFFSITILYTRT